MRVLRKRPDGYHDIATLMQRIGLYDEMLFSPCRQGIVVKCPGTNLPQDEQNIVYRAAKLILAQKAPDQGVEIAIKKNIPIAAGLGGGSSNAATALMALNELFGLHYENEALMAMGAGLGADVPFFILEKSAWATGIGTHLKVIDPLPFLWFVLINPNFEISTKMVYENLNLTLTKEPINYSIPRLYDIPDIVAGLINDLERVTLSLYPVLRRMKEVLIECGAMGSLMSGSGPTVFGIFDKEETAAKAQNDLIKMEGWSVFRASSI